MCSVDDGIGVYDGHNPGPVGTAIWFKDPKAVVRVRVSEALAVFVDEGAFIHCAPEPKREEEVYPRNIEVPYPPGCALKHVH